MKEGRIILTILKTATLSTKAWFKEEPMQIFFPESWEINECDMAGHDTKELTDDEIKVALRSPFGTKRLAEIASNKKTVTVIFDDMTRPTPDYRVVPFVLDELREGGIKDEDITFVCAIGGHKTTVREDWVLKLGEKIVENYDIFNHNVYDHFVEIGTTSRGTPVELNQEVASAEVKVGIGGIKPHSFAGYGGGGKMILPGVVSLNTIETNHKRVAEATAKGQAGYTRMAKNVIRSDMEEAARLAGLDFKVDLVFKCALRERKVTGLFAGDFVEEHRAGVEFAKTQYVTVPKQADIVITNTYPVEDEGGGALWTARAAVKEGGDVVVVQQAFEGQTHHYVYGQFGRAHGGHLGRFPRDYSQSPVPKAKRVIYLNEYFNKKDMHPLTTWVKSWAEVLEILKQDYNEKATVSIFPYGYMQHPPVPENY